MTAAHRNITITDDSESRDDIARLYSEEHAQVWGLIRTMGLAAPMLPPMFEVHALIATAGEHTLQSRGRKKIEKGWLALYPKREERLDKQLPEDTNFLEQIAELEGPVAIGSVTAMRSQASDSISGIDPADLIRLMREKGIGRPSTYANHVGNVYRAAEQGLVSVDEEGGFHITDDGLNLLRCLDMDDVPSLDVDYSARLENDLEAIESGGLSAAQVLRIHLGKLPGVAIDIPDAGPNDLDDTSPTSPRSHAVAQRTLDFSLPVAIDPDAVLPKDHPLRIVRRSFDDAFRQLYGHGTVNRAEGSKRRACRAVALAKLLGDWPLCSFVERLSLDLGLRWVVDLKPTDIVWTPDVLSNLVAGESSVVANLCAAVCQTVADSLKELKGLYA